MSKAERGVTGLVVGRVKEGFLFVKVMEGLLMCQSCRTKEGAGLRGGEGVG